MKELLKDVSLEGCREIVFGTYEIKRSKGRLIETDMKKAYYTYSISKEFTDKMGKIYKAHEEELKLIL